MRLERLYFDIERVDFCEKSDISNGTLMLAKSELELLCKDTAFSRVEIDVAAPGSDCRLMNVGDITQPTVRLGKEDTTFPGLSGKMYTVGDGRSISLRGVVVTEVVEVDVDIPSYMQLSEEAVEITDFANMWHITIDAFAAPGIAKYDYLLALNLASKRVAQYIATLAANLEPDEIEIFELESKDACGVECIGLTCGLPRVAYLANVFCHRPYTESLIYGASMLESLPTILHPNEILDGALTNRDYDNATNADPTFVWQNHPIILELYRRHGVDLNFVGVVVSNVHHELSWKETNATMASALLANYLNADAVIITKEGGGHPQVDIGIAVDTLEGRYGIKTAIVLVEMLSAKNDSNGQIIFSSDYADAMVSTGCASFVTLPVAKRVIGSNSSDFRGNMTINEAGEMTINHRALKGGQSQLGWTRYGSLKF
ncbi:MAG: glycine/sarcosine/betaine reductase component B subunit [Oscillospiraceae bacterium]|nr:glycine/sarcosine/betaine reductase component B subunit [Oscillospiraceae bacterium]